MLEGGDAMQSETSKRLQAQYLALIQQPNQPAGEYNGILRRWANPVLTRAHIPPAWRFDFDADANPLCLERLGVNATFNSGAILLDGVYYLAVRVEGCDRKSFFALAKSDRPAEGFVFECPIVLPDTCPEETNVYDMRLTKHEDGWIYGLFCSESKDRETPDLSAAVASVGIVRTKDLRTWERLPNLKSRSPQQRNVVLFPEKVQGKYAVLTRPQDGFIEAGKGGGICFALCESMEAAEIDEERLVSPRVYHTITESKNGAGAVPIKTEKGWLHIAHGVRNTAAGLRYVLYLFVTDLQRPWEIVAAPSGYLMAPVGGERVGDVSNVLFSNGAAVDEATGEVTIYYASSDTRLHAASTTVERLLDYAFNTPADALRSADCVRQRMTLIQKNEALLEWQRWMENVPADDPWRGQLELMEHDAALRGDAFRQDLKFGTGGLRAEMGAGRNRMNLQVVARATLGLANHLKTKYSGEAVKVCVAYDTRNNSRRFAECAARVLCACGIAVEMYAEARPTPMLSFAVRQAGAQAGLVLTASHNPKEYNGYKAYGPTGGQLTDQDSRLVELEIGKVDVFEAQAVFLNMPLAEAQAKGLLSWLGEEADERYYAAIEQHLPRRAFSRAKGSALRMIYTPLHGCGLTPVTQMLARLGYPNCFVVPEQADGDGGFPTVPKPNPEEKAAFTLAMRWAKEKAPDVVFATDPDADRIGVMVNTGGEFEVLSGTQTGALLCDYLIRTHIELGTLPENAGAVTTIVTGTLAERICKANGVYVEKVLTGFKYIGETMDAWQAERSHSFLFGFEESYGYLTGDACRDKDAVIASALVAEMALYYKLEQGINLYQALQNLYAAYGAVSEALYNHEAKGAAGQAEIQGIMRRLRANWAECIPGETVTRMEDYAEPARLDDPLCGVSKYCLPLSDVIKLYFKGGEWLVLRPSGTEPKIKLYVCTDEAFAPGAAVDAAQARCAELTAKAAKALLG